MAIAAGSLESGYTSSNQATATSIVAAGQMLAFGLEPGPASATTNADERSLSPTPSQRDSARQGLMPVYKSPRIAPRNGTTSQK